eukprot:15481411-Alexandrium_andersonii.AAC.1
MIRSLPAADRQIMTWELLRGLLGVCSFAHLLRGCMVRLWTDNTSAEACSGKGTAGVESHNAIVHHLWHAAAAG